MALKQDVSPHLNFKKDSSSRDDGYFSGEGRCWVTAALREMFLLSLLCQRNESSRLIVPKAQQLSVVTNAESFVS